MWPLNDHDSTYLTQSRLWVSIDFHVTSRTDSQSNKVPWQQCSEFLYFNRPGRETETIRSILNLGKQKKNDGYIDAEADILLAEASSAICVQRFDDSRDSAIHITYRSSLRSSSLREPRYPLLRVVLVCVLEARPVARFFRYKVLVGLVMVKNWQSHQMPLKPKEKVSPPLTKGPKDRTCTTLQNVRHIIYTLHNSLHKEASRSVYVNWC